jgi:N-acylglucosamine 2-epimerase
MANNLLDSYYQTYYDELVSNVIPFWERNSPDPLHGAYFTCLDRDGSVYDTDKFMWVQWREVWMFSELYSKLQRNENWLRLAESGYHFLTKYGKDEKGRYYFSLTRDGKPTEGSISVFSECFAVMGAAAYYRASGDEDAKKEALQTFNEYLHRENLPDGTPGTSINARIPMKTLGYYMMKANLYVVIQECFNDSSFEPELSKTIQTILTDFWNPEFRILFENVGLDGTFDLESMSGRHLNPGHGLEAMWFVMSGASRMGRPDLVEQAADIALAEIEYGWDSEYGGIYSFLDVLGKPHMEPKWNMKVWWSHNEALVAMAMAYKLTGRQEFADWFERIHDWAWNRFSDPIYGEWFGDLDRYGNVANTYKGGMWKGFFHLPRALFVCQQLFNDTESNAVLNGGLRESRTV